MKRWLSRLLSAALASLLVLALTAQPAEAVGGSLYGSSGTVRAGETVAVTFSVYDGDNVVAINGSFSAEGAYLYDTVSERSGWHVETNGNIFTAYDTSYSSPINGSASVFTAYFIVYEDMSPGSTVRVDVSASSSDGDSTSSLGSDYWSATVAAPLSGNANLSGLSCGNASLSPDFSSDNTSYSATVPYDVTYLDLSYSTADSGASAWTEGNSLDVGSNTVSVGVEAANGAVKYYNIYVTRQQDPNYKASTNALLSSLEVSAGRLSPSFDANVKEYVVYVPYEVESIELSGSAQDSRAQSVTGSSSDKLKPGDNPLTVVCVAEDGVTKGTYTVHVYRMPAYAGTLPQILDPGAKAPESKTEPKPEEVKPEPVLTPWQKLSGVLNTYVNIPGVSYVLGPMSIRTAAIAAIVILALLCCLIGILVGRPIGKRRALRALTRPAAEEIHTDDSAAPVAAMAAAVIQTPDVTDAAEAPAEPADAEATAEEPSADAGETDASAMQEPADGEELSSDKIRLDDLLDDIKNM